MPEPRGGLSVNPLRFMRPGYPDRFDRRRSVDAKEPANGFLRSWFSTQVATRDTSPEMNVAGNGVGEVCLN